MSSPGILGAEWPEGGAKRAPRGRDRQGACERNEEGPWPQAMHGGYTSPVTRMCPDARATLWRNERCLRTGVVVAVEAAVVGAWEQVKSCGRQFGSWLFTGHNSANLTLPHDRAGRSSTRRSWRRMGHGHDPRPPVVGPQKGSEPIAGERARRIVEWTGRVGLLGVLGAVTHRTAGRTNMPA